MKLRAMRRTRFDEALHHVQEYHKLPNKRCLQHMPSSLVYRMDPEAMLQKIGMLFFRVLPA